MSSHLEGRGVLSACPADADRLLGQVVTLLTSNRLAIARRRLQASPVTRGDARLAGLLRTVEGRLGRVVAEVAGTSVNGFIVQRTPAVTSLAEPEEEALLALAGSDSTVERWIVAGRSAGMDELDARGILAGLVQRGQVLLRSPAPDEPEVVRAPSPELGRALAAARTRQPMVIRPRWMRTSVSDEPGPGGR